MQRHGDVEVESIVVDDTDCEEHRHHDHIVTGKERVCFSVCAVGDTRAIRKLELFVSDSYLTGIAGFFLPKCVSKMKPSIAMNKNWAKVTMLPQPGNSLSKERGEEKTDDHR